MKINRLTLTRIFSFGPQQVLDRFTYFNLFIGRNGTGKTNVFRVLDGLPYDLEMVTGKVRTRLQTHDGQQIENEVNVFTPSFGELSNTVLNRNTFGSHFEPRLQIDYQGTTTTQQAAPEQKQILFDSNAARTLTFKHGDVVWYDRYVTSLALPKTNAEIIEALLYEPGPGNLRSHLAIVSFGINYIFGATWPHTNLFDEFGMLAVRPNAMPSGVLHVAMLLTSWIRAGHITNVYLLDEPELHLEPRNIRRLFSFLVWLSTRIKHDRTIAELPHFNDVQSHLENSEGFDIPSPPTRNRPEQNQIFIASHSPVLINEFMAFGDEAAIYEFKESKVTFERDLGTEPGKTVESTGTFTHVRRVGTDHSNLMNELGCKGADLLQCNGIVWVEGPSDIVYLKKWLSMYSTENELPSFTQGRQFEFNMYGGAILSAISLFRDGELDESAGSKLVAMFSFSRNSYVIIDSDAIAKNDGVVDQSTFSTAKTYIADQFNQLTGNQNIGLWFDEGNTAIKTIEDYLDESSLESAPSGTKTHRAKTIVERWTDDKKLSDFRGDLGFRIQALYNAIALWNS